MKRTPVQADIRRPARAVKDGRPLGDGVIHAVTNPTCKLTSAIRRAAMANES